MSNTINSDLIRGNINTIILKALYDQDRYGYDIIKEIEVKSRGQYILKQPTLYSCLKRLETQGFIRAYWGTDHSNGGRRKYYTLTDMGKEVFSKNQNEYEYSRTIIDQLISDKDYDLETLLPYIDNGYDDIELPRRVPGGRFDADESLETDEPLDAEPFETD
ncbi:MAG: PadR family transcriptional regulator [Clostridiales bacterium]|nr:PadR family transcriptional regulator [Clostridiales bacterium]